MAILKSKTYLDTGVSGLVIQVEHNLGGTPDLYLTEPVAGQEIYVPLMDARIAEVKTLDQNNVQVTFASAFTGFLYLMLVEVDNPSDHQRILDLEERYVKQFNLIEDKVSTAQFEQMSTLVQSQIASLQSQINDLQSQVNLLETDVESL